MKIETLMNIILCILAVIIGLLLAFQLANAGIERDKVNSFCYDNSVKDCYDYCSKSKLTDENYCLKLAEKIKFIKELE